MSDIINACKFIFENNAESVINMFKEHKTPLVLYLKMLEYLNNYKYRENYNKKQIKFANVINTSKYISFITLNEFYYLDSNDNFNINICSSIYNFLVSPKFIKEFINSTWLKCILCYDGKFEPGFNLTSDDDVSTILLIMTNIYKDINRINFTIIADNDGINNFKDTEYLVNNTEFMYNILLFFEEKFSTNLPVYIRCLLYNYQYINNYENIINYETNTLNIDELNNLVETNNNNTYINKSRFNLCMPILSFLKKTNPKLNIMNNGTGKCDLELFYTQNEMYEIEKLYLENGLLMLGNCYEGMGYCTHLVFDLKTDMFLMFTMYGSNDHECLYNKNLLDTYINKSGTDRLNMLHDYYSKFNNNNFVNMLLASYIFMNDENGEIKSAFNFNN